jgi:lysophospholipase L1-like esterase
MGNLMHNRLVTFTGVALIAFVLIATVEIAAYAYTTYLAKEYGIIFYLPHITENYATYSTRVNPLLGWPSPQTIQEQRNNLSGKATTASDSKNFDKEIPISAYGDSFTAGFGVEPEYTWSNVLSKMLGCRIANYGVPGYGTDQSYLRFHYNTTDEAQIVLFGQLSENIQRNLNQLRNFLAPIYQCQTKPRFVLTKHGQLQFVPIPQLSAENYDTFIENPVHFLTNDYFLPGGPSGAQKLEFPYTWSIIKAYNFFYNHYILGYKSYLQFYQPDHPSQALPLTMAIINQFIHEAKDRGKHPIILVFPTDEDFRVYRNNKQFVYKPLINKLEKEEIEYIDLGSELLKRLGNRNYMDIFSGAKYFHFNKEGNRLVAQIIYDYFTEKNYCPQNSKQTSSRQQKPKLEGDASHERSSL